MCIWRPQEGVTMGITNDSSRAFRELAHRVNDGIEIVLFWQDDTNDLTVSVSDERTGAYFELAARPHEALDVFHHPYAHAAFRGVPFENELLPAWAEAAACDSHITAERSGEPTK
jgi:hypothetical protein